MVAVTGFLASVSALVLYVRWRTCSALHAIDHECWGWVG
jgi:hypothetical protein